MVKKNAIILSAGKSNTLAPFTYEKPKGLFKVKNEILIERQINQLIEAGVAEIYVVVGYMKEKFFYLTTKYNNVHLIINNRFGYKGNVNSLYVAREFLNNTYVCSSDQYFVDNPFLDNNNENKSYRMVSYLRGKFGNFAVSFSESDVITDFRIGGKNEYGMVGYAYFNSSFSKKFRQLIEEEIDDFGVISLFWEEFYARHIKELTLYSKITNQDKMIEFDGIDDLRAFDCDFLTNIDSDIVSNICETLKCNPNEISDITVINAGLTNVSFGFTVNSTRYVYRHPGGSAGNLIDRQAEIYAQLKAKEIGIDESIIKIDPSGWKISYFVNDARNCDFKKYPNQLKTAMDYLRSLHSLPYESESLKVFDDVAEGKKLMTISSSRKGNLFKEFADIIQKIDKLDGYIKEDAKKLGYKLVLCHNDAYEPNFLYDNNGEVYLIDWEYAGLNYAANDICCVTCRSNYAEEEINNYFEEYVGRELTKEENRFYWAFHCICAFYWFCWGLYKGSVGDDDGFFFLPAYTNCVKYIDKALKSYEEGI